MSAPRPFPTPESPEGLPVPEALWRELHAAYQEPPRHYHTWEHVLEVVGHLRTVAEGPGWQHPREVFLAALFHDAVYEVGRRDNEARSAELAAEALSRHLSGLGLEVERVRRLILLTARHGALSAAEVSPEEALFLDCDMAVLGAPWERFEAYDKGVEAEYTAHMLEPLYRVGRRRFLQGLLEHERLYLSDFFHQRLEARARENLRRALG